MCMKLYYTALPSSSCCPISKYRPKIHPNATINPIHYLQPHFIEVCIGASYPSGASSTCAILFLMPYCAQSGHERMVLNVLSSAGKMSWPLRPDRTCFTILEVTSSISKTGSLKSGDASSGSSNGVRIQPGLTTLRDCKCKLSMTGGTNELTSSSHSEPCIAPLIPHLNPRGKQARLLSSNYSPHLPHAQYSLP